MALARKVLGIRPAPGALGALRPPHARAHTQQTLLFEPGGQHINPKAYDALDRIAGARDLDPALSELVVETEPWDDDTRTVIPQVFSAASPLEVLERLADADSEAAAAIAKKIARHSPTSLELAHRAVSRATAGDVADAVTTDFRILARVLEGHDFFEGIRAAVIDKDQAPRWAPAEMSGVDLEEIEAHFTPPPHGDLNLEGLLR